jgi:hypothetical protein
MNCDRCDTKIEKNAITICSDCLTELEQQAQRTLLELAAGELYKRAKNIVEKWSNVNVDHNQINFAQEELDNAVLYLNDILLKIQDNPSPQPNPLESDEHKSAL